MANDPETQTFRKASVAWSVLLYVATSLEEEIFPSLIWLSPLCVNWDKQTNSDKMPNCEHSSLKLCMYTYWLMALVCGPPSPCLLRALVVGVINVRSCHTSAPRAPQDSQGWSEEGLIAIIVLLQISGGTEFLFKLKRLPARCAAHVSNSCRCVTWSSLSTIDSRTPTFK